MSLFLWICFGNVCLTSLVSPVSLPVTHWQVSVMSDRLLKFLEFFWHFNTVVGKAWTCWIGCQWYLVYWGLPCWLLVRGYSHQCNELIQGNKLSRESEFRELLPCLGTFHTAERLLWGEGKYLWGSVAGNIWLLALGQTAIEKSMVNRGDYARALWNASVCWSNVDTNFQKVLDSKRVWCLWLVEINSYFERWEGCPRRHGSHHIRQRRRNILI